MAGKTTSLSDFEPFFGGDKKGAMLVQAMFEGTNYSDTKKPISGLLKELLRAENYKGYQNVRAYNSGQAQQPDDIPQDITDLIITTALFHRKIDKSSTAGTNIGESINRIERDLEAFLNKPIQSPVKGALMSTENMYITTAYNLDTRVNTSLTNGDLILYILTDRALWESVTNPVSTSVSKAFMLVDTNNTSTDQILDYLSDCSLNPNPNDICWGSIMGNGQHPAMEAFNDIKAKNSNIHLVRAVAKALKTTMRHVVLEMKQNIMDNGFTPSTRRTNDFVNAGERFLTPRRKQIYMDMLKNEMRVNVTNEIRDTVNSTFTVKHTTLDTTTGKMEAKKFFDELAKLWPSMKADNREFYIQNISVFTKVISPNRFYDANVHRNQNLQMDWVRLTPEETEKLFNEATQGKLQTSELVNLRVNLMKSRSSTEHVLFGSNLPDVPDGVNVWYTNDKGAPSFIPSPKPDFLRALYAAAYADGVDRNDDIEVYLVSPVAVKYKLVDIEEDINKRPKAPFNLDVGKFISAAIRREDDQLASQMTSQPDVSNVGDDLSVYPFISAYDMAYGKLWSYDDQKKQYYRTNENGTKIYYDDAAQGDTGTCYATYLAKGNPNGCLRVIQCIADGDSESLNRCLDVIGDGDLWAVASDDAQKVGPDKIKLVLRKFGVQGYNETDSNGVEYIIPMTYEEWNRDVVENFPPEVKNTIRGNSRLNTYLKGLISVCRSNPNIINKSNPQIIQRDTTPDYIKNLNMRKYKIPSVNKKAQYEFFADMLRNAVQPHNVTQDMFNPITSGSFSNVMFFNPYTTMSPSLMGGSFYAKGGSPNTVYAITPSLITKGTGSDALDRQAHILKNGSASMFTNLLGTIQNAFLDVGMKLHPEDAARLRNVVEKIETYENQLARMCLVLITIVKTARLYGISLENVDKDHPRTIKKLSELHSEDDIKDFVRQYARELTRNMVTNMSIQQSAAYELMSRVGPRLIDECYGKNGEPTSTPSTSSKQLIAF